MPSDAARFCPRKGNIKCGQKGGGYKNGDLSLSLISNFRYVYRYTVHLYVHTHTHKRTCSSTSLKVEADLDLRSSALTRPK